MKKKVLIVLLMFVSMFAFACTKPKEVDPDQGKEIISVEVVKESIPKDPIDVEEFDLSPIKLLITYADDTTRLQELKEDMLDEDDLALLKKGITKRIVLYYKDFEVKFNLSTIDYRSLDPKIGDHELIAMIKRDEEKTKGELVILTNEGFISGTCAFKFDSSEFEFIETSIKANEAFTVQTQIKDNELYVLFMSNNTTNFKGETVVLEFSYRGDYRKAAFEVDKIYNNSFAKLVGEELEYIEDINYHYSLR